MRRAVRAATTQRGDHTPVGAGETRAELNGQTERRPRMAEGYLHWEIMNDPAGMHGNYRYPSGGLGFVYSLWPQHLAPEHTLGVHRRHPAAPPAVSSCAAARRAACPCRAALMAPPPPAYVPVLKRRSENRVLEDVKKVALKHCDGLVKEFVDCTKVRVSRRGCVVRRLRWASSFFSFAFSLQGVRVFGSACRISFTAGWWLAQSLTPVLFCFLVCLPFSVALFLTTESVTPCCSVLCATWTWSSLFVVRPPPCLGAHAVGGVGVPRPAARPQRLPRHHHAGRGGAEPGARGLCRQVPGGGAALDARGGGHARHLSGARVGGRGRGTAD